MDTASNNGFGGPPSTDTFSSNRFSSSDDAFGGAKLSGGFDESFGSSYKPERPADPFHAAAVATADPFGDKQRGTTANNAITPVVSVSLLCPLPSSYIPIQSPSI